MDDVRLSNRSALAPLLPARWVDGAAVAVTRAAHGHEALPAARRGHDRATHPVVDMGALEAAVMGWANGCWSWVGVGVGGWACRAPCLGREEVEVFGIVWEAVGVDNWGGAGGWL